MSADIDGVLHRNEVMDALSRCKPGGEVKFAFEERPRARGVRGEREVSGHEGGEGAPVVL